jgi:hypothetical protein
MRPNIPCIMSVLADNAATRFWKRWHRLAMPKSRLYVNLTYTLSIHIHGMFFVHSYTFIIFCIELFKLLSG